MQKRVLADQLAGRKLPTPAILRRQLYIHLGNKTDEYPQENKSCITRVLLLCKCNDIVHSHLSALSYALFA